MNGSYDLWTIGIDAAYAFIHPLAIYALGFALVVAFLMGHAARRAGTWKLGKDRLRFILTAGRLWPRLIPALLQDCYNSHH